MRLGNVEEIKSEINVTPLVDVVLVLLIIFMVVTPLMNTRNIQLPETSHPGGQKQDSQTIVYLGSNGALFLQDEPIIDELLVVRLSELYRRDPGVQILLHADRRLKYSRVMQALDLISRAGFLQIGLVAQPSGES